MKKIKGLNPFQRELSPEELEQTLDDIYSYLEMNLETMSKEELDIWTKLLEEIDPNIEDEHNII